MKIIYPFYPGGKHEKFADAVNQFGMSPYELIVASSPDCQIEVEQFISKVESKFGMVTRLTGSSNSPTTVKEKDYWENLLLYSMLPIFASDRSFVFLHEDDMPSEEGWATKLENVIFSSGSAVIGYCNFKDNGLVPSGTLLFNNILNSQFRTWRFPAKSGNFRYNMRYEMLNYGDGLRADILPFEDSFKWSSDDEDKFYSIMAQREGADKAAKAKRDAGNARREELYQKKFPEKKPIIKSQEPIPSPEQVRSIGAMPATNDDVVEPKELIKDTTNESINFAKLLQPKAPTVDPDGESTDRGSEDIVSSPEQAVDPVESDFEESEEVKLEEKPKKTAKKATKKTARKRAKKTTKK